MSSEFDDYAVLEFEKDQNDIEQPKPLPEEWYILQLLKAPEVKPNKWKAADPEHEKAGDEWVAPIRIIHPDPEINGRRLIPLKLPLPGPKDKGKFTGIGQPQYDAKMERIVKFCECFGGEAKGRTAGVGAGACGQAYITQFILQQSGDIMNSVGIYNNPPFKPVPEGFVAPELPSTGVSDEDIPF